LLNSFASELKNTGFTGNLDQAKLVWLVLNSGRAKHPVSLVIRGPSGSGKSYLLNTVLEYIPNSAYEKRSSLTPKALAYSTADFKHKHLVVQEAAGINGSEGLPLLRTLLSEGEIRHEVTVAKSDGGGYETKSFHQPGPTGLVMTTTETRLHLEDESRLLSIEINDSRGQILAALESIAIHYTDVSAPYPEPHHAEWRALTDWMQSNCPEVMIPFAKVLSQLVDPFAHRLRRDFAHLLTLIETHAALHMLNRNKDSQGRIQAELRDYEAVHDLVAPVMGYISTASVDPQVRETVEVVKKLVTGKRRSVTNQELAAKENLNLDPSACSRRVKRVIELGYLANDALPGKPAEIRVADPLPEDVAVLPTPQELERAIAAPSS